MPLYYYKGRDGQGRPVEGQREGGHPSQVAAALREEGLFITEISQRAPRSFGLSGNFLHAARSVKLSDLAGFCRQLAVMQEAGIPLLTSLQQLGDQTTNKRLRQAILSLIKDISAGKSLAESAGRQEKAFTSVFVHMIAAGELGGILDEVLLRLAEHFEREQSIKEKIKTAMTYPIAIIIVAVLAVVVLLTVVLPKFVHVLEGLGVELPRSTQLVMGVSSAVREYWYFILLALAGIYLLIRQWAESRGGKRILDSLVLKVPGFGKFIRNIILARFTRTLGTLLKTGVQIIPALEIVGKVVGNKVVEMELVKARKAVQDGRSIAAPLENSAFFPPMVVQMMQVGEETGTIDALLIKLSVFYEREVDEMAERLSKLIEPVLLLFLGGSIGFLIYSILMPMFSVITNIG